MASRDAAPSNARDSKRLSPYATPSATREVLERHGLYTKYALGQNFLVNDDVVRKIVELADIQPTDSILEVGPGIGTLTSALLQKAGHVTSIEMDHDLPAVLRDTLAPWLGSFTLLEMDGLDLREEHLREALGVAGGQCADDAAAGAEQDKGGEAPDARDGGSAHGSDAEGLHAPAGQGDAARALPNKLVSNLPYAVAATIVLDYLQRFDFLQSTTVMVQKEVADRMMAKPGTKAYGAYTVKLALCARPAGRFSVAPGNFFPPPHVESAVIRLDREPARDADGNALSSDELRAACTMADAAFATRRKTLANSCKTYFSGNPEVAGALPSLFERAGIDPRRRGETLSLDEFVRLGKAYAALT